MKDYYTWTNKFLTALKQSYITTTAGMAQLNYITNYESIVRDFVTNHNLYFQKTPQIDLCTWYYSFNNMVSSVLFLRDLRMNTIDPGLQPLIFFLNIPDQFGNAFIEVIRDNITNTVAQNCL